MPGVSTVRNVCTMHFDARPADIQIIIAAVNSLPALLAAAEREAKLREVLRRLADLADVMADTANDSVCDEAIAEARKLLEVTT